MLAAARREKVEDRLAIAESAGLKTVVMDIESYAARAATDRVTAQMPACLGQVIGLFQIGTQITHISMLQDGVTLYEREQRFGGNQLTQDIARAFGLSFEEAEIRKKSGELPQNYQDDILKPFLESAALEVSRAMQFFFTSTPWTRVDRLFFAGGCASLAGLSDAIAARTRISSAILSPFQDMQLAPSVRESHLQNDAPAYLVACGLALRRFAL